jgi:hypothetical protein
MQIGGGPYSVVSESPVCLRSASARTLAQAIEHIFALDESYCCAGIFVRVQVQQVTLDMASSVNSPNDSDATYHDVWRSSRRRARWYQAVIWHHHWTAVPTGCPGWRRTTRIGT